MIKSDAFWLFLEKEGYTFFSGVPCSILEPLLRRIQNRRKINYVPAVNENIAIGIASGASLSGRKSGILIQNSGLGNIVNPLTSFNLIYKVPVLIFITWRGYLGKDAPEHTIMGKKMLSFLGCLGIPSVILTVKYKEELKFAMSIMEKRQIPVALIIKEGLVV